jgi:isoquinoline 1-oxidoreductase alpha subunit
MKRLNVNGRDVDVDADSSTPLLWVLRDHLGLTGTKYSCGIGACGACTVHIAGKPVQSCLTKIGTIDRPVTTIEGVSTDRFGKAVQEAWVKLDVVQCGYCQSGQIMAAAALLRSRSAPSEAEIDAAMRATLCRCGTYPRIRAAIKEAARALRSA